MPAPVIGISAPIVHSAELVVEELSAFGNMTSAKDTLAIIATTPTSAQTFYKQIFEQRTKVTYGALESIGFMVKKLRILNFVQK